MSKTQVFLFMLVGMFLTVVILGNEVITQKIRADLIVDMAKMGYFQKEVDGNILWIKDEK